MKKKTSKVGFAVWVNDSKHNYLISSKRKTKDKKLFWSLPGGLLEGPSDISTIVTKAVEEEAGIRIMHLGLCTTRPYFSYVQNGTTHHVLFFKAVIWPGLEFKQSKKVRTKKGQHTVKFVAKKDLPSNLMYPLPKYMLQAKTSQELL